MSPSRVKGIIFDLDGTLIHSTVDFPKMKRRMIAILEGEGAPRGFATPKETTVVILERMRRIWDDQGKPQPERARVLAAIDEVMDRIELEAVRERGYMLAVLTRGHHTYAVEALRKTGMLDFFDLVLGRGETPRPKPYPEALEHAADLMGLRRGEVLFVGDNLIDSTCADNAGVRFIAVLSGSMGKAAWAKHGQKPILNSVRDLPDYLAE